MSASSRPAAVLSRAGSKCGGMSVTGGYALSQALGGLGRIERQFALKRALRQARLQAAVQALHFAKVCTLGLCRK